MFAIDNVDFLYGLIDELRARGVTRFKDGDLEFDMLPKAFDNQVDDGLEEVRNMELPVFGPRDIE